MKRVSFAQLAYASMAVALLALGRTAEARSTIEFCNVGNTALSMVTIGDHPSGGWTIDGWRTIQAGDCLKVDTIFKLAVGVAITKTDGQRGMQVYDQISGPEIASTRSSYCVDPMGDFHHRHDRWLGLLECRGGEVPAHFAFNLKPIRGETLTVHIPADKHGAIIPFEQPTQALPSFPPFQPFARLIPPQKSFEIATRGLGEQQERLRLRMERMDPSQLAYWGVVYFRDLGIMARPETHVVSVVGDSPAHKAGIRHGDEILQFDDISVQSAWHARGLLVRTRPGETHTITYLRGAELRREAITLGSLPAHLALSELHPKQGWLGVEFESAARVVGVIYQPGAPHLELGDDILKIDRSDFDGLDGLARWLARNADAVAVEMQVRRKSTGKIVVMTMDRFR